jgi:hypothetical protein
MSRLDEYVHKGDANYIIEAVNRVRASDKTKLKNIVKYQRAERYYLMSYPEFERSKTLLVSKKLDNILNITFYSEFYEVTDYISSVCDDYGLQFEADTDNKRKAQIFIIHYDKEV